MTQSIPLMSCLRTGICTAMPATLAHSINTTLEGGGGYLCLAEDPPENKAVKPPGWLWGCLIQPSFSFFGAQHTEIRGWVSTTSTLAATGPPFPSQTPLQLGVWEALPLAAGLIEYHCCLAVIHFLGEHFTRVHTQHPWAVCGLSSRACVHVCNVQALKVPQVYTQQVFTVALAMWR